MQKLFHVLLLAFLFSFFAIDTKGDYLQEIQAIPGSYAKDIESFTIDGETYLAIVNEFKEVDGSYIYDIESKVYKWNGSSFVEFQSFIGHSSSDWEYFTISGEHYLALSSYKVFYCSDSKIYKWNGSSFVEFQTITTKNIVDFKSFTINGDTYLASAVYSCFGTWNDYSVIYKWNGSSFSQYQSILTSGAAELEFL